ncbi:MAG: hypothetical protein RL757_2439 [Bacteroidota bacterium]|jgi:hypothetical protein
MSSFINEKNQEMFIKKSEKPTPQYKSPKRNGEARKMEKVGKYTGGGHISTFL